MDEEIGFLGHLYSTDVRRGLSPLQKLDQPQFRALLQVPPCLFSLVALHWRMQALDNW